MNRLLKAAALAVLFAGVSCEVEERFGPKAPETIEELIEYNKYKTTIGQGISGTVIFQEGNCAPPADTGGSCSIYPVSRKIRLYRFTTREETDPADGAFFSAVHTPLVATVESDGEGFYEVALAPGRYSLFIEEDSLLYANLTGKDGGIQVSVVDSGWVTLRHPEITYKASY